ncbi:hypothetical protein MASR2M29_22410 [Spirochaetota bacterium]
MHKSDWKEDKHQHANIYKFSSVSVIKRVAINPSLLYVALKLTATVTRKFFVDQFLFWASIKMSGLSGKELSPAVTNIEHEMDTLIPVRYEAVKLYLTFVKLWVSALSYFSNEFGKDFDGHIRDFLEGMQRCYSDAASIYDRCLSTTRRPAKAPNPGLALVYAVDPHLFCVPSLHVIIVCYTFKKIEDVLLEMSMQSLYSFQLAELRKQALAISESVLYVRQHSINCIPTALAMLTVILPAFTTKEAKEFMNELWQGVVAEENRAALLEYMSSLYDHLLSKGHSKVYEEICNFVAAYDNGMESRL